MSETTEVLSVLLSIVLVLFMPGFMLSWALFPKKHEIDWLERIAVSFGLSMGTVPLVLFSLNLLLGVRINSFVASLTSLTIILVALGGYIARKRHFKKKYFKWRIRNRTV